MSKDKQIEEMARIICKLTARRGDCEKCGFKKQYSMLCSKFDDATDLYNAGYRKQEWISVEERLPEEGQRVLLYSPADGVTTGHRLDEIGRFYVSKNYPERPTHWMPLPEPPKMKGGAAKSKVNWRWDMGVYVPFCPYCDELAYEKDHCVFCNREYEWVEGEHKSTIVEVGEYIVVQATNNHIHIYKDGRIIGHVSCTKKMTEDELIKALQYDRDQYNKGYRDALITRSMLADDIKAGVAREIFEEIEKLNTNFKWHCMLHIDKADLAKLKKKYTEEHG